MMDKNSMVQRGIVQLNTSIRQKAEQSRMAENENSNGKHEVDPKAVMANKIATAKMYGNREIKEFRKLVNDFCAGAEKLCLFGDTAKVAHDLFIATLLEEIVEPVIEGKRLPGLPEEYYRAYRRDTFGALIKKYAE